MEILKSIYIQTTFPGNVISAHNVVWLCGFKLVLKQFVGLYCLQHTPVSARRHGKMSLIFNAFGFPNICNSEYISLSIPCQSKVEQYWLIVHVNIVENVMFVRKTVNTVKECDFMHYFILRTGWQLMPQKYITFSSRNHFKERFLQAVMWWFSNVSFA